MMVCCTMGVIFPAFEFFVAHFFNSSFCQFHASGFVLSKDGALGFGSLSLCVGIFICMSTFAYMLIKLDRLWIFNVITS